MHFSELRIFPIAQYNDPNADACAGTPAYHRG